MLKISIKNKINFLSENHQIENNYKTAILKTGVKSPQILQQLLLLEIYYERINFLTLFLKLAKLEVSRRSLFSLDHKNGTMYLIECFPWRMVPKLGT